MPSFLHLLTVTCIAVTAVAAIPQADSGSDGLELDVPELPPFDGVEVVPGPGLPSLASLGLSSADLWNTVHGELGAAYALLASDTTFKPILRKRYTAQCTTQAEAPLLDVLMCTQYLKALGEASCNIEAPQDSTVAFGTSEFCSYNKAKVWARCPSGNCPGVSKCQDVANGLEWVYDNCITKRSTDELWVSGTNSAIGNGDVHVFIEGI